MINILSKSLILLGGLMILIGVLINLFPDKLFFFGNMLGDLSYETKKIKVFFPLGSMIVISVILTIIFNYIIK